MKKRCAIYTRKSTEEGLDQAFNSLDAQHDACTAFIASQKHESWVATKARYDDGGFSGGTMERPGLQKLLDDVRAKRIDVVVVYKIDRLTRSLTDFARIVEVFDEHEVSFVSVTQQFNTTTSMGRLTLNVLLSFAQFEREVTAERIRDKIAASKQKGMWMGGVVPLGYDARDKKLIVNEPEAETVRTLFRLYLELGTVRQLKQEADQHGIVTKQYVQTNGSPRGGKPFSRGHLYRVLANPLYRGMIRHRGVLHEGEHSAIVDEATWNAVQGQLNGNAPERSRSTNTRSRSLLTGLLYDDTGDRLSPSHAIKQGKRYRYYISHRLKREASDQRDGWRLPAEELERSVLSVIAGSLRDVRGLQQTLSFNELSPEHVKAMDRAASTLADTLERAELPNQKDLLATILCRIDVQSDRLSIELDRPALASRLLGRAPDQISEAATASLSVPIAFKRRGVEAKLLMRTDDGPAPLPNKHLIETLMNAHRWFRRLTDGSHRSIRELAARERVHPSEISRVLPLVFLAPDITEAILEGRHPVDLTSRQLKRLTDLPADWTDQRRLFV